MDTTFVSSAPEDDSTNSLQIRLPMKPDPPNTKYNWFFPESVATVDGSPSAKFDANSAFALRE